MRDYLLSVIIPTRNRQLYCLEAVKQIHSLNIQDLEICIQDNSDDNRLEEEMKGLNYDNLIYHYHSGLLSFVDNFSEAVSLSHGEYLCMIGDDDGILPNIIEFTSYAKNQYIDAVIPALNYIYYWPSKEGIIDGVEKGVLQANLSSENNANEIITNHNDLVKLLRNAVQDYTSLNIPRLYHGIVKKSVLDSIKGKTGNFFGGLTPDMYMAAALSLNCKKILRVNKSVTISGICPTSGSSDSATGKHTGELKDAPHFKGHKDYRWDEKIPGFYSVDTIWGDTLLHALHDLKQEEMIAFFNLPLFEGVCLKKYPAFKDLILQHAKGYGISSLSIYFAYKTWRTRRRIVSLFNRVSKAVMNKTNGLQDMKIVGIGDIQEAEKRIRNLNNS